jgi:ABC-type branched-subunit amino acid transport system substrate-binding protein
MRRQIRLFIAPILLMAGTFIATGGVSASAGAASSPIKIGVIGAFTGPTSEIAIEGIKGITARVDLQNSRGGVYGHKLQIIQEDDANSATQSLSAAQIELSKGAFGIIDLNTQTVTAIAPMLLQQNIPLVVLSPASPSGVDKNAFSAVTSPNPKVPVANTAMLFLKKEGAKSLGCGALVGIPPSINACKAYAFAAKSLGLQAPYIDLNVALAGENYTADGIAMKASGIDTWEPAMTPTADLDMLTAAKQAGANITHVLFGPPDPSLFTGPSLTELQGAYFTEPWYPLFVNKPGPETVRNALVKYDGITGVLNQTDFNLLDAYLATDIFIEGLTVAGAKPTDAKFIKNLRNVTDYTAGGMTLSPINLKTDFGKTATGVDANNCEYFFQLKGNTFEAVGQEPVCGKLIPNSFQQP